MNIILRTLFTFALLVMVPCNARSEQTAFSGPGIDPNAHYAGGPDAERRAGLPFGPPPEAYKVCEGKTAGSPVQLISPRGDTITGTCEEKNGKLFLSPNRSKGNLGNRHLGPPPEAYTACEGKTAGSPAQLISPRGDTITGTCEEKDGKLFLRPDMPKGGFGGRPKGPSPEAYKACEGKTAGSPAQFTDQRGNIVKGTCEKDGERLFLRPDWLSQMMKKNR